MELTLGVFSKMRPNWAASWKRSSSSRGWSTCASMNVSPRRIASCRSGCIDYCCNPRRSRILSPLNRVGTLPRRRATNLGHLDGSQRRECPSVFDFDALHLARIQFGFTISFHIIFPGLTIGLASYLVVLEGSRRGRISHHLESHASHLTFNGGCPHAPLGSSLLHQRYRKGRQRNYLAHYGPEYLLG